MPSSTSTTIATKKTNLQNDSQLISKFIKSVSVRNKNTAKQYQSRLLLFERFVIKEFDNDDSNNKSNVDKLIQQLKNGEIDPYDILNDYCLFVQNNYNVSSITFRDKIITVKTFLEFNDIEISLRKFKLKVRYPKTIFKNKEAIDKDDIIRILNKLFEFEIKNLCYVVSKYWSKSHRSVINS